MIERTRDEIDLLRAELQKNLLDKGYRSADTAETIAALVFPYPPEPRKEVTTTWAEVRRIVMRQLHDAEAQHHALLERESSLAEPAPVDVTATEEYWRVLRGVEHREVAGSGAGWQQRAKAQVDALVARVVRAARGETT